MLVSSGACKIASTLLRAIEDDGVAREFLDAGYDEDDLNQVWKLADLLSKPPWCGIQCGELRN